LTNVENIPTQQLHLDFFGILLEIKASTYANYATLYYFKAGTTLTQVAQG